MADISAPSPVHLALKKNSAARLEALRSYRYSWWSHWARLAEMFDPRRYKWFANPNNTNRGAQINSQIVDETGVLSARVLKTGLLSNLTSPARPWFRLAIAGYDPNAEGEVQAWLAECTSRQLAVYNKSNFYQMLGQAYGDLGIFGSSPLIQYEDDDNVIHFFNPCMGEFFYGLNAKLEVDSLFREYTYTIKETVDEFGLDNVSVSVRQAYTTGGSNLDTEIVLCHAIEPNTNVWCVGENLGLALASRFSYRECYWEQSTTQGANRSDTYLRIRGFREKPFVGFRWDVQSNDAYGRSPGMEALPAVLQLQIEQRRKAEAIDKMVRPPMVGSINMRNEPSDTMPGGITYVTDVKAEGFKPAFTVEPRINELKEDIKEVQQRVYRIFFNDLFTDIMQLQTVRTATEIDARVEEKLILLGPVVERMQNEGLDDIITRTFNIMLRRGLFPPPPEAIAGADISIDYISALALAQRASATTAIERTWAFAGNLAAVNPDMLDNLDPDSSIRIYADKLNVPPAIMRALAHVAAIRAKRSEEQQAALAVQTGDVLAKGAQTLSNTEVGGGQSALQMMLQ